MRIELKELKGWDTFRSEPGRSIEYLSRSILLKYPGKEIKEALVFVLGPLSEGELRAEINFPGYCERWTTDPATGMIESDYILDDADGNLHVVDAGPVETRAPIKSLEELADFLIEYAQEIDVPLFLGSYQGIMG